MRNWIKNDQHLPDHPARLTGSPKYWTVYVEEYLHALEKRFKWLADNPYVGAHRPEIREGYFSYVEGSHLIFYLKREGGIDIIGLPHQCMDIGGYFS